MNMMFDFSVSVGVSLFSDTVVSQQRQYLRLPGVGVLLQRVALCTPHCLFHVSLVVY